MTVERFFIKEAKKAREIEAFLRKELELSGFSHADIKRTPLGTRIIIYALRPGIVIGGGGSNIKKLTVFIGSKFGVENPHLEVEQVRDQFLDPHIVAWRISRSMERGGYFKRIANMMLERVMQAGAKGVEIRMGGKLPGSRAKTWIFVKGKLRKCGQDAIDKVKVGYARSVNRMGTTGIKVSLLPPGVRFSDEVYDKSEMPVEKPVIEVRQKFKKKLMRGRKDKKPVSATQPQKAEGKKPETKVPEKAVEMTKDKKPETKVPEKAAEKVEVVKTDSK